MISFEEEIFDRLREMGGSKSAFVNSAVSVALQADGVKSVPSCEFCGSEKKPLIWIMPNEKLACVECEETLRKRSRVNITSCQVGD